jgi:hypothetical protein
MSTAARSGFLLRSNVATIWLVPVVAAAGRQVLEALGAVDLLFERRRDGGLDHLRARADVVADDVDLRRRERRELRDGQAWDGHRPARMIMSAQTVAKMGRRMKKSTNTSALRRHGGAVPQELRAGDDHLSPGWMPSSTT